MKDASLLWNIKSCTLNEFVSVPVYPGAAAAKQRRHLGQLREHPYQRAGALSWKSVPHGKVSFHLVPLYFLTVYLFYVSKVCFFVLYFSFLLLFEIRSCKCMKHVKQMHDFKISDIRLKMVRWISRYRSIIL